jgi:hypothetical protein
LSASSTEEAVIFLCVNEVIVLSQSFVPPLLRGIF